MTWAVVLDRDGTINEEVEYLSDPAQLCLIDGAAAAIRSPSLCRSVAHGRTPDSTQQPLAGQGVSKRRSTDGIAAQTAQRCQIAPVSN